MIAQVPSLSGLPIFTRTTICDNQNVVLSEFQMIVTAGSTQIRSHGEREKFKLVPLASSFCSI